MDYISEVVTAGYHARSGFTVRKQFQNGGMAMYILQPNWQRPSTTFGPVPGVEVEPGRYDYLRHSVVLQSDPSARVAVRVEPTTGGYFDGRLHSLRADRSPIDGPGGVSTPAAPASRQLLVKGTWLIQL